jgi:putative ABC transport system ATP-binding protein
MYVCSAAVCGDGASPVSVLQVAYLANLRRALFYQATFSTYFQHLLGIFSASAWDVFRYGKYNGSENDERQMLRQYQISGGNDMIGNVIEITNLTKTYGSGNVAVHALQGVDVQVERGEFVAIMGPSGSGKSTLMNVLGCLDRATDGTYVLDGEDVSELSKDDLAGVRNRKIGFVFQSYNLLPRLSAVKNVMLLLMYCGHDNGNGHSTEKDWYERSVAALESVGLGDRIQHRPSEMSGGQQQRVAIARALINKPSIILADEPTGNLDTHSSNEIMDIFHNLHGQGATIVMVTHEPENGEHVERVITIRDGQVV